MPTLASSRTTITEVLTNGTSPDAPQVCRWEREDRIKKGGHKCPESVRHHGITSQPQHEWRRMGGCAETHLHRHEDQ